MLALLCLLAAPKYEVEILRDEWGVPHVLAKTDAAAVYGLMFAQAEDNFAQLERDTLYAIGRAAELDGERGVPNDIRVRAFEVPKLARERLAKSPAQFRRLASAYADGLNRFLDSHPEVEPKVLQRFEPWYFLCMIDLPGNVDGVTVSASPNTTYPDSGSNAWALAPHRMEGGAATLFLNPHVGLFGMDQRYECHLISQEGWHFSGFAILGRPIPHAGHNGKLGWAHTNTRADGADAYLESFDDPANPLAYRYGDGWRQAVEWEESIAVGREMRKVRFRKTHHGPILGTYSGRPAAIRFPIEHAIRFYEQKYEMGRSRSFGEFKQALDMRTLNYSNTTYADAEGHIAFWYGNLVPKRDSSFDWSRPVEGRDPKTEWKGIHSVRELPSVVDPKSGFVQNGNSHPWLTTSDGNPDPRLYPNYIVRDTDSSRARNMRRILTSKPKFSVPEVKRLAFDTHVLLAEERLPELFATAEKDPEHEKFGAVLSELRSWDRRSSIDSIGATLYFAAEAEIANGRRLEPASGLWPALQRAVARLEKTHGTWRVPWGQINRVRKPGSEKDWPVAGAPGIYGQVFAFGSAGVLEKTRYGVSGNTFVSVVEFSNPPRAWSVSNLGQSGVLGSPHFEDQAPLYSRGILKPAWFELADVLKGTRRRTRL